MIKDNDYICDICDEEINPDNPGKRYDFGSYKTDVCDKCAKDPDFQEIFMRDKWKRYKVI